MEWRYISDNDGLWKYTYTFWRVPAVPYTQENEILDEEEKGRGKAVLIQ